MADQLSSGEFKISRITTGSHTATTLDETDDTKSYLKGFIRRSIRTFRADLFKYSFWTVVLLFVATTSIYFLEFDLFKGSVADHIGKDQEKITKWDVYWQAFWWAIVTFSTVGYGDISPTSHLGKFFAILIILTSFFWAIVLSGAVASILVAAALKEDVKLDESKYVGHTIIGGWNDMVLQILRLMSQDDRFYPVVVLINETADDVVKRALTGLDRLDIIHIHGNHSQESALEQAFLQQAEDIIVVPDNSGLLPNEKPDEQKTVLAVFTAKSISEELRVIAHITDPEQVSHLQRANCDEIVLSDDHTPKFLANHILNPGAPQVVDVLFSAQTQESSHNLSVLDIPSDLISANHSEIFQHFRSQSNSLLIGYAIRKAGFSLEEMMGESGSDVIRGMITEQFEREGIKLTSDEKIVVEINPPDDYQVDEKHRAILLN